MWIQSSHAGAANKGNEKLTRVSASFINVNQLLAVSGHKMSTAHNKSPWLRVSLWGRLVCLCVVTVILFVDLLCHFVIVQCESTFCVCDLFASLCSRLTSLCWTWVSPSVVILCRSVVISWVVVNILCLCDCFVSLCCCPLPLFVSL